MKLKSFLRSRVSSLVPLLLVLVLCLGSMTLVLSSPKNSSVDSASAASSVTSDNVLITSTDAGLKFGIKAGTDFTGLAPTLPSGSGYNFGGILVTGERYGNFNINEPTVVEGFDFSFSSSTVILKDTFSSDVVPKSKLVKNQVYTLYLLSILDMKMLDSGNLGCYDGAYWADVRGDVSFFPNLKTYTTRTFRYNPQPLPTPPTKPGFTFEGWYVDEALTQKYVGTELVIDMPLYAKYTPIIYTVTFNTNYPLLVPTQSVQYEGLVTLPALERYGHTFGGWFSDSSLTAAFDSATKVTENTTLYAKWIPITLIVTFYVDGEVWQTLEVPFGTTFEDPVLSVLLATGTIKNGDAVISSNYVVEENVELSYKVFSSFMASWLKIGDWLENYWWILAVCAGILVVGIVIFAVRRRS